MEEGMHIDKEEKPHPANPLLPIVENLMSTALSGHKWKAILPEELMMLLRKRMMDGGIRETERHWLILKKKLTKCDTMEACLMVLEEVLF
jgi:hypothetical protein